MEKNGLKKLICFDDDSDGKIKEAIEKELYPNLENKDWGFYKCVEFKLVHADIPIVECRFDDLKG